MLVSEVMQAPSISHVKELVSSLVPLSRKQTLEWPESKLISHKFDNGK